MYLSDQFVNGYKKQQAPFGGNGLGHFVYLRTYSRWNEDMMRREEWYETVRRVVEYSMALYQGPASKEALTAEAELLFDTMFNLRLFTAGRTMWIGGTESAKKFGEANFNCSFIVVDKLEAFVETFHLLMVGSGVGFRVLPEDVAKLPVFNTDVVVAHKPYHGKAKAERIEDTLVFEDTDSGKTSVLIVIGDSKAGWVNGLGHYLNAMLRSDVESIVVNYDSVRPQGEELKTFGGRASGHQALKNMFRAIHKVITKAPNGKLRPIDAMDIQNHIGANVVVGGVRRTSEIALFGADDKDILNAKVDLWTPGSNNYGNDHRGMSNNSIFFNEKPTRDTLLDIFTRIQNNGEPGFVNAEAARKRRPNFSGLNPCAEILLADRGVCNLTEVNMAAFLEPSSNPSLTMYDHDGLVSAVKLATRIGLRQTNVNLDLTEWDAVQKRDRLTGVSLSGMMDFESGMGWNTNTGATVNLKDLFPDDFVMPMSISLELAELLKELNNVANQEAIQYAKEMRVPTPLLVTTVKPSGTISKLPMISSGAHRSRAPYFIRRVRITSSDPLAKVMLDAGYPVYPSVTSNGPTEAQLKAMKPFELASELQKSSTWVIEFPVATNAVMRSSEESAVSQLGRYLDLQKFWTDHNTSITIEFDVSEVEALVDMLLENWDDYVAVSFMPKDTTAYPQLPEEPITEAEYLERAAKLTHINAHDIVEALKEVERENKMSELLDADCAGGACPVR
jgi:adenosylcobalamin-dependent ribonucleoside-triphosphate reductase